MDTIICSTFQTIREASFECLESIIVSTDLSVCVTVTEGIRFHTAIQVYKILHNLSPSYLNDKFRYSVDITAHASQNIHCLFIRRARTT